MNLHEYQVKRFVIKFWSKNSKGIVASTVDEAVKAAEKLNQETGTSWWVVKAQIHAGEEEKRR